MSTVKENTKFNRLLTRTGYMTEEEIISSSTGNSGTMDQNTTRKMTIKQMQERPKWDFV